MTYDPDALPALEYDTKTLLPWCCEGCFARRATHRLHGVMEGGPTFYCLSCGQEALRALKETSDDLRP